MILVDTSAWVEFLRDTGSPTCEAVDRLLSRQFATCDAVSMELLAGARDDRHLAQLKGLLARATMLSIEPADYDMAATLYRSCRAHGSTVRKLIDCLIAAVALRHDAELLHSDSDFTQIARHTDLRLHAASLH